MVLLDSGCICCTVRGDLTRALTQLINRRQNDEIKALSRVVIETTGLADPAPVIQTLKENFWVHYRIDGVVTVVDVTHIDQQLAKHFEAVKQVAMADRLLLTKCDLATQPQIDHASHLLAQLNPGSLQIQIKGGECDVVQVLGLSAYDVVQKPEQVRMWLGEQAQQKPHAVGHHHHHHDVNRHDANVVAHVFRYDQPLKWSAFAKAIDSLQLNYGDRILRIKGIVNVFNDPRPVIVQGVGHARYPITFLNQWPNNDHTSRIVFIVSQLSREPIMAALRNTLKVEPVDEHRPNIP
jgi:G3E family GTPase